MVNTKFCYDGIEPIPAIIRSPCGVRFLTKYDLDVHLKFCDDCVRVLRKSRSNGRTPKFLNF